MTTLALRVPRIDPAWWLLAACTLLIGFIVLLPIASLVNESLLPVSGPRLWTIANYKSVVGSAQTWLIIRNTVAFSLAITIVAGVSGFFFAWIAARTNAPGRSFMPVAVLLPYIMPGSLGAICWILFMSPSNGLFNQLLQPIFGHAVFNIYSFTGMVFVETLYTFPLAFLFFYAALITMNPTLEEASAVSGAGVWKTLWSITLPAMLPVMLAVATLLFIIGLESFDIAWFIGYPARVYTLPIEMFVLTRVKYPSDLGSAAVYGVLALLVSLVLVALYRALTRDSDRFVSISGKAYRPAPLDLGRLRIPASMLFYLVIFLVGVLPILLLGAMSFNAIGWPLRWRGLGDLSNWRFVFNDRQSIVALRNTGLLTVLGAGLVVLVAFMVSYLTMRTRLIGRSLLDYMAFMPLGFPVTVLALGIITSMIRTPVYNTIWILIIAFAIKFLPYALRNLSNSMIQIHRELEEASFVSGAGLFATMWRIMMPLVLPGMVAAWSLLFIIFGRQFSLPMMLTSSGTPVITTIMFLEYESGIMGHVAAYGILLIVCSMPLLILARYLARDTQTV